MNTYNFSANGLNFGSYEADSQEKAQEIFAQYVGCKTWAAMVERASSFGCNNVEVKAI